MIFFILFLFFLEKKKQIGNFLRFKNTDYSNFINNEIRSNINLSSEILGWQNYFFFKNIKKLNLKVKKTINWFENQPLDKGWNFGARTFYPKADIFGYQGFTFFPQYMCLNITKQENLSKLTPKTILSIGKAFNNSKKEFYKSVKIKNVPALSFQYLYNKKIIKKKYRSNNDSVLIVLSGFIEDDVALINWIISSNLHKTKIKIYIKEHPILKFEKIKNTIKNFPKNFIILKKNFNDSINIANKIICSGATSAIIELIVRGRHCYIPKLNPHDGDSLKNLKIYKNYTIIENHNELIKSLKKHKIKKHKIKKYKMNNFFIKINKNNLSSFL